MHFSLWRACDPLDEDEHRLAKSLRQGPEDIGREYQRNMQTVGDNFACGDGMRALYSPINPIVDESLSNIEHQLLRKRLSQKFC